MTNQIRYKRIDYRGFKNYFDARKWADKQRQYGRKVTMARVKTIEGWGIYVYERRN